MGTVSTNNLSTKRTEELLDRLDKSINKFSLTTTILSMVMIFLVVAQIIWAVYSKP